MRIKHVDKNCMMLFLLLWIILLLSLFPTWITVTENSQILIKCLKFQKLRYDPLKRTKKGKICLIQFPTHSTFMYTIGSNRLFLKWIKWILKFLTSITIIMLESSSMNSFRAEYPQWTTKFYVVVLKCMCVCTWGLMCAISVKSQSFRRTISPFLSELSLQASFTTKFHKFYKTGHDPPRKMEHSGLKS